MEFRNYPDFNRFEEGLNTLNIKLSDIQKQQFVDYYELLIHWNQVMNLTAITEFSEVIMKHFIDSLSVVKVYEPKNQRILDMGTGAGFPGIPLKIAFPETEIILLDSLKKRINFLEEVTRVLNLKKVTALHARAEDYGRNKEFRETFDLCVSRAVAKLSVLSEYCLPYVKKEGYFIPYKSGRIEEELTSAKKALMLLGAEIETVSNFTLPDTDMERSLIVIHKTSITPSKYPRSAGKPAKGPLM
jgi:16S rRNA (guanine527-N7)-methyltransferase